MLLGMLRFALDPVHHAENQTPARRSTTVLNLGSLGKRARDLTVRQQRLRCLDEARLAPRPIRGQRGRPEKILDPGRNWETRGNFLSSCRQLVRENIVRGVGGGDEMHQRHGVVRNLRSGEMKSTSCGRWEIVVDGSAEQRMGEFDWRLGLSWVPCGK